jgi:phosphoenolpyruvate phosphomutase
MQKQAARLRDRFRTPGLIRLAGSHDALGARLAERAGFEGVWASSFEISASHGVPDEGILDASEFLAAATSMMAAVNIPVVADCDCGFGSAIKVIHMVRRYEAAGVAAVCIEDKVFPKVNSIVARKQKLASITEFAGKIEAAKSAQRSSDFMVIARVEALIAGESMAEALHRAHAYTEAGADAILIHDKRRTPDSIVEFCHAWDGSAPLVVVPTTYYSITASELSALGVKMVIYANQGLRARVRAVGETFAEILKEGTSATVEHAIAPMSAIFELQGYSQLESDERKFVRSQQPRISAVFTSVGPESAMNLRRNVAILNAFGIYDVTVTGLALNKDLEETGAGVAAPGDLDSVFARCGKSGRHTLVGATERIIDKEALESLLNCNADIAVLADPEHGRGHAPITPAATRLIGADGASNGSGVGNGHRRGCYGLALFSPRGLQAIRDTLPKIAQQHTISLSDVLQQAISQSEQVRAQERFPAMQTRFVNVPHPERQVR